jgi:ubiquinone/menaquinone biosynthesis C-methylase UbiE
MAQNGQQAIYKQGYSNYTTATQETRTAEEHAAFLIPYIKKTDHILDVGCGPGTITTGFAKFASEGSVVGIDLSAAVLQKARALAAQESISAEGPGSVTFVEGNVLEKLPYGDETFDIVYASQVFGHLLEPGQPLRALAEIRRVLKPAGILATRDAAASHFYPKSLELDRLWVENLARALRGGAPEGERPGTSMLALFRKAGFDVDGGKVRLGAGTLVYSGLETRKWLAWRANGQLRKGDALHKSWLDAGITEDEIQQTLLAVNKWVETEDAWFATLLCEMLAWK